MNLISLVGKLEHKEEIEKERPSLRITCSHPLFKVESKVGIKPYQGEIDVGKLNQ
jgi:hypothetical protein